MKKMKLMKRMILCIFFLFPFLATTLFAVPVERRKQQFENNSGYLVIPTPYSFPGIGEGWFLIGYAGNIVETPTDAFIIGFVGDAEGYVSSVSELFVVPDYLYLSAFQGRVTKFGQNRYSIRGMESDKEDYNIFIGNSFTFNELRATLTLFDRRLEISGVSASNGGKITEILDSEENLITKVDAPSQISRQASFEFLVDLTDDFYDPLAGVRFKTTMTNVPASTSDDPEYNVWNLSATYYLPMFKTDTWAFQVFRSSASVLQEGNTDLTALKTQAGFDDCSKSSDRTACEQATLEDAKNTLKKNKNGTARPLGGTDRLRSYPGSRYSAAHTLFYGMEYRWNLDTGLSDIDIFILQDIAQAVQIAFFAEQGSVAEEIGDLGKIVRSSYGLGTRLVTGSGAVYRFDVATGDEGQEVILFFEYPWNDSGT